ncbi:mannose-6-phosphate isomerase type 1 [Hazenella coriacea]|uniref:mannose-6-phosphate isomerase n=1 Tax=Hazenella coriacea TaxID=1179467 RepID=A0A4R3L3X2_9BACL|nr:mannose-6-phosphate isomerase type 1 [Hazenella coriacea]
MNGPFQGCTLDEIWCKYKELFAFKSGDHFPLLVKILDANHDLSVQVHPNDLFAQKLENSPFGKTECWYVLDCESETEVIIGHHATTRDEFKQRVTLGEWEKLLRRIPIKPGDFFYVPSGTIHSIGKGALMLEIQQNSDITYRLYDYDRLDHTGVTRPLQSEKSLLVTTIPDQTISPQPFILEKGNLIEKRLITSPYFTVYHWTINGKVEQHHPHHYWLCTVIQGTGHIQVNPDSYPLTKGDFFILPATIQHYHLEGNLELICTHT